MTEHSLSDYDSRATTLLTSLAGDGSERAVDLAARLVKLIGTDSPRLISAVHAADALVAKRFDPNQVRDPHTGEWTDGSGSSIGASFDVAAAIPVSKLRMRYDLTEEQDSALEGWMNEGSEQISNGMRGSTDPLAQLAAKDGERIVSAMKPLKKPVKAWRGTSSSLAKMIPNLPSNDADLPGHVISDKALSSVTGNSDVAVEFATGEGAVADATIWELTVSPDVKALYVPKAVGGDEYSEQELLLEPNVRLLITEVGPDVDPSISRNIKAIVLPPEHP